MNSSEILVFGAGCFWGAEDLIREIEGVIDTEVGYCGGTFKNPGYHDVCTGETGHAEAVKVTFDAQKVSREQLLELFFKLHNPTTKNRQGGDVGSQYRSVIFYASPQEKALAEEAIKKAQSRWKDPIVTSLEPLKEFYPAEQDHQDYLRKNPGGYTCHYWRE
jgi:peptide-methionine (S)-S-oxide reductase